MRALRRMRLRGVFGGRVIGGIGRHFGFQRQFGIWFGVGVCYLKGD